MNLMKRTKHGVCWNIFGRDVSVLSRRRKNQNVSFHTTSGKWKKNSFEVTLLHLVVTEQPGG